MVCIPSGYDEQFAMVVRWPIEMDDFPSERPPPFMVGIFHGELLVIIRWYLFGGYYNHKMVLISFDMLHNKVKP